MTRTEIRSALQQSAKGCLERWGSAQESRLLLHIETQQPEIMASSVWSDASFLNRKDYRVVRCLRGQDVRNIAEGRWNTSILASLYANMTEEVYNNAT